MLKLIASLSTQTIATGLCVGTINAFHSGLGGGGKSPERARRHFPQGVRPSARAGPYSLPCRSGFMLVRSSSGSYEMIDFRETMPLAGNETMYASDNVNGTKLSTVGGLAVGVPGELRGWQALHQRHGKLPWHKLFEPAVKLARDGFPVNFDLADAIQREFNQSSLCMILLTMLAGSCSAHAQRARASSSMVRHNAVPGSVFVARR